MNQKLLVLFHRPPTTSAAIQEGLEALMSAAAMDWQIDVVLCHNAVFALQVGMSQNNELKNYNKIFYALPDFGIDTIYLDETAVRARQVNAESLAVKVQLLTPQQISQRCANADQLLTF